MAKTAARLKTISAFIARNRLGSILERVKTNEERFVVSRKGEATAVILGYEDFLRSVLRLKAPVALRKTRESARRSGASTITPDRIELEIRAAREGKRHFTTKATRPVELQPGIPRGKFTKEEI